MGNENQNFGKIFCVTFKIHKSNKEILVEIFKKNLTVVKNLILDLILSSYDDFYLKKIRFCGRRKYIFSEKFICNIQNP